MADFAFKVNQGAIDAIIRGPFAKDLEKKAIQVESAAKRLAPVDTGRLRGSISHSAPKVDGKGLYILIGSDVEYAIYQEFGTRYMGAQPFLRPALDVVR